MGTTLEGVPVGIARMMRRLAHVRQPVRFIFTWYVKSVNESECLTEDVSFARPLLL